MRSIIVGFDATDQAKDALALAETLRDPERSRLIVVAVDSVEPLIGASEGWERMREKNLERCFQAAHAQLGEIGFERRGAKGSVPAALGGIARDEDAGLIVVGSTHRGTLGRVLPGSVGERLLKGSPCAVAVAPRGYARSGARRIATIGVGYDASRDAGLALRKAQALARRFGARLRMIGVAPEVEELTPGHIAKVRPAYARAERTRIADGLDVAVAACPDDLRVESVLVDGDPKQALAEQTLELDLLLVGSRGYGPIRTVFVGSVSSAAARSSACPVIVTPRSAEAHEARSRAPGFADA
jgi:nucleotide-binding universal stress UspA family protein